MPKITKGVDRQAAGLLSFMAWSNVAVIIAVIILNVVNMLRITSGEDALISVLDPQLFMIVSLALMLYLAYGCYQALSIGRRLSRVFVSLDEDGISGASLPQPVKNDMEARFSLPYDAIQSVSIVEVAITKKHTAPSLKLESAEQVYIVPAPEGLKELVNLIAERMTAK